MNRIGDMLGCYVRGVQIRLVIFPTIFSLCNFKFIFKEYFPLQLQHNSPETVQFVLTNPLLFNDSY